MMHRNIHPAGPVSLALQGGGAHGAFTWGVLDRLLQLPGLAVPAVSATSSGAMNAAALAQGWAAGGAEGAREMLHTFWHAVARRSALAGWWLSAASLFDTGSYRMSLPPAHFNPLRGLVEQFFDVDTLRHGPVRLHVAATRVRDGALTLFSGAQLDHDALLASACLPRWFPAVDIAGEPYWDGGYAGNPVLEPLLSHDGADLLCVLCQPLAPGRVPGSRGELAERTMQLAFSAAFRRELRDLALARRTIRTWLPNRHERALRRLRLHLLQPDRPLTRGDGLSAADVRLHHLQALHARGHAAAEAWCTRHAADLGRRASFDLDGWLRGDRTQPASAPASGNAAAPGSSAPL